MPQIALSPLKGWRALTDEVLKASVSKLCVYAKLYDTDCRKPPGVDRACALHTFGSDPDVPLACLPYFWARTCSLASWRWLLVVCCPVDAHACMSHVEILAFAKGFTWLNMLVLMHPSAMSA